MTPSSLWILEYSCVDTYPVSGLVYGRHNAGTAIGPHCYGVVVSGDEVVMIDAGMSMSPYCAGMAARHAIDRFQPPEVVLGRIGISPDDVTTLVVTHGHFDHAGGLSLFPNARVHVQRRELEMLRGLPALPDRLQWLAGAVDPQTVGDFDRLAADQRLTIADGPAQLRPGLAVRPAFDTHTSGSQYVVVDTDHDGRWIFAGDGIYVYENLEGIGGDGRFVPVGLATGSQERNLRLMDEMVTAVGDETRRVLPFHDEQLWSRFPSHTWDDGLRMAEITRAPEHATRLPA